MSGKRGRISVEEIRALLPPEHRDAPLILLEQVDSTNDYARKALGEMAGHGAIVIARRQTAGKGRRGRSFFSPEGGLYMSLVLGEIEGCLSPRLITPAAALAVCRAVEGLYGLEPKIKWVNDIFLNGKKVCGILAENVLNSAGRTWAYVVGMGVNLLPPEGGYPPELEGVVGDLGVEDSSINELAAAIASELFKLYEQPDPQSLCREYEKRMFLTGRKIRFSLSGAETWGTVLGIDDNCGLVVRRDTGDVITLTSGEVSLGSGELIRDSYDG